MAAPAFKSIPLQLTEEERKEWARRQRTAENTLAIQALGRTTPNEEIITEFQRYVSGEITLSQAIAEQMAQEHASFRQYLNLGNA